MWVQEVKENERWQSHVANLFLAVLQHVLVLGEFFVLLSFDAFGLVPEPVSVLLLQPLDGLLLLTLQVLHLLVVLALLTLVDRKSQISYLEIFTENEKML